MAKKISDSNKPTQKDDHQYIVPSREDRKHKKNGKKYLLTHEYRVYGQDDILLPDTPLIECNDGYYAIIVDSVQMCYRIGPNVIESITNIIKLC